MPPFYFHLHDGNGFTEDREGQDLRSIEAARLRAVMEAREVMAQELRTGELNLAAIIEVHDEAGECLFTLSFGDAVRVSGHR